MAKRKKSNGLLGGGIAGIIVVVLIVALLVLTCFRTPDASTVAEKLDGKEDVAAYYSEDLSAILSGLAGLLGSEYDGTVYITDSRDEDKTYSATVTYYKTAEAAKEAAKDAKENRDEDSDVKIFKRGNAVFIGDSKCLTLYLGVLF